MLGHARSCSVNFQVKNLPQQWLDLGRIHVQIYTDDFIVQPVQFGDFLNQLQKDRTRLAARVDALQVAPQQVVVGILGNFANNQNEEQRSENYLYLFQLYHIGVHRLGAIRREQRDGTHDQNDVLIGTPLFVEGTYELFVLLVDVPLGQLEHVRPDVGHLLLAVGNLQWTEIIVLN